MTTVQDTVHSQGRSTYDVYIEIDCDCEELLDAIGLDYKRTQELDALGNLVDSTQNEVKIVLNKDEFCDVFETIQLAKANEQVFASRILNPELGEYTTKVTVYTPHGDKITFE